MDERFARACSAFDAVNAQDPRAVRDGGQDRPRELVHAERVARWIERLAANPSEALRLAARCQHVERWTIPREQFPPGREGYLQWRRVLAKFHADRATAVLRDVGYDDATIEQVQRIVLKRGIKRDDEVQTMEDALCLTFLEREAGGFAARHAPDKVVAILRKTLVKMSDRGKKEALGLELPAAVRDALGAALDE
jgi:hypothetical protein